MRLIFLLGPGPLDSMLASGEKEGGRVIKKNKKKPSIPLSSQRMLVTEIKNIIQTSETDIQDRRPIRDKQSRFPIELR